MMCCQCVNQTQMCAANLRSACFFSATKSLPHVANTGSFRLCPINTHNASNEPHTQSSGVGSVRAFYCGVQAKSLPMPCGCPCATTTLSPCPGASGQEGRPDPSEGLRRGVGGGGGTPTPITLLRMLLSAALSACPASDRTTKAATATETAAALVVVMKPFDRRHHAPQAAPQNRLNTQALPLGTPHDCYS